MDALGHFFAADEWVEMAVVARQISLVLACPDPPRQGQALVGRGLVSGCSRAFMYRARSFLPYPFNYSQACTLPKIQQKMKGSGLPDYEAAKIFNILQATAVKLPNTTTCKTACIESTG